MKKHLLSLGLALCAAVLAYGAKTNPQGELVPTFSENFNSLVNGTEAKPAEAELSLDGKIDAALTGGNEWKGRGLHEAGGALAVMTFEQKDWFGTETVQGYIRSPFADVRMDGGNFTVRFRARKLTEDDALTKIHIELYDAYTTNAIETGAVEINGVWSTYEVDLCHPGYGNHLAFVEMASEGGEWLIDDFEIVQDYYALPAPIVHFPRNVSYEQFTGRWNAVPLADTYLVSVYSLDENDKRTYLIKDVPTNECTLTVNGTVKGTDYYYRVRCANSKYQSDESEERKIHVPLNELEQPVPLEAENVGTDGFVARWEPTYRAMGYIIGLSKEYIASEDLLVTLAHEDFDKITDGDLDWPYPFYGNLDDVTNLPGWQYNYFGVRVVAGMFGLDNMYKAYGEDICLTSPALDLTGDGGKFTVKLDVYGDKGDVVSVSSGDKTLTHTLAEQGLQSFSLEFDNGTASSKIRLEFDGDGPSKLLFFDNIYIQQAVHAGDAVKENVGTYRTETPATYYEFKNLNASEGDTYIYTVTAWSYSLDEDGVWGPDIFSEISVPVRVLIGAQSGIENVENSQSVVSVVNGQLTVTTDVTSTVEIYSVNGMLIGRYTAIPGVNTIETSVSGMAIVRVGNKVNRVVLR